MTTATVSANTNSAQDQPTKEPRKQGVNSLIEIIERVSLYEQERPLDPGDVSELYDASESIANHARALSDRPDEDYAEYFAMRLALLRACVAASKSGKFNLPPREMKRMAGVFAVWLFREISQWGEILTQEGRETLKETMKKFA